MVTWWITKGHLGKKVSLLFRVSKIREKWRKKIPNKYCSINPVNVEKMLGKIREFFFDFLSHPHFNWDFPKRFYVGFIKTEIFQKNNHATYANQAFLRNFWVLDFRRQNSHQFDFSWKKIDLAILALFFCFFHSIWSILKIQNLHKKVVKMREILRLVSESNK